MLNTWFIIVCNICLVIIKDNRKCIKKRYDIVIRTERILLYKIFNNGNLNKRKLGAMSSWSSRELSTSDSTYWHDNTLL